MPDVAEKLGITARDVRNLVRSQHLVGCRVEGLEGSRVPSAFLSAAEPGVPEAVAAARASGPVAVASYLIGPGFFQRKLARAGGDVVAQPLGAHPGLVSVVVDRYLSGCLCLES